jgi:hypothetical protein
MERRKYREYFVASKRFSGTGRGDHGFKIAKVMYIRKREFPHEFC